MCNAWNHPPDCACGWGGEGHLGRRGSVSGTYNVLGYWWVPHITQTHESYINPNAACPVCGAPVYFYQASSGGRVFFDELGPPWPKHPCTNNKSTPARLTTFPIPATLPEWQTAGWVPFYIIKILGTYKFLLEIKGNFENQSVTLFLRKNSHTAITQISKQCIAFLKQRSDGCFDLSLLTESGIQITTTAFPTLLRASESTTASPPKMALRKKSVRSGSHNKKIQASHVSSIALAFAEAEKKQNGQ